MRPLLGLLVAFVALVPAPASAQAVLHPNQIQVDLAFTNANPEITRLLDATLPTWSVAATSVALPTRLRHTATFGSATRRAGQGEITVESSAAGVAYDVEVYGFRQVGRPYYLFPTLRTAPVLEEPAPDADVTIRECAGLVRVVWLDAAGNPDPVTGGDVVAWPDLPPAAPIRYYQALGDIAAGAASVDLLVRGDTHHRIRVRYTTGTDDYSDKVTWERTGELDVPCDAVVVVQATAACAGGPPPLGGPEAGFDFGRLIGRADVVGENENPEPGRLDRTSIRAEYGPWNNRRYDRIVADPASGDFELENLVPSAASDPPEDYTVTTTFSLRSGLRLVELNVPQVDVTVPNAATLDAGDIFVLQPGFVRGDIVFAAPPVVAPRVAPLDHVLRITDDPAGPADTLALNSASRMSAVINSVGVAGTGWRAVSSPVRKTNANFAGAHDPALGEFRGDYELVTGGPAGSGTTCDIGQYELHLEALDTPEIPESFIWERLLLDDLRSHDVDVAPAAVIEQPIHQCFSQVILRYISTGQAFFDPWMIVSSLDPTSGWDFEGRPFNRSVGLQAYGTPRTQDTAAIEGAVQALLPEGSYTLEPSVRAVNPGGGTSRTELLHVALNVGCRQVIELYDDIVVDAIDMPPCTEEGTLMLTGSVHGTLPVARIAWTLNGGPEVTWCTDCGTSPAYAIPVALADADNVITVRAEAADGRSASRTLHSRFAKEPSALDRNPAAAPLGVRKDDTGLALTWENDGSLANVYQGTVASLHERRAYDHAGVGACGLAGGQAVLPAGSGSAYFLVGAPCEWGDSSLGRDSYGRERPQALGRCP